MTHSKVSKGFKSILPATALLMLSACGGSSSDSPAEIVLENETITDINGGINNTNLVSLLNNATVDGKAINLSDFTLTIVSKDDAIIFEDNNLSLAVNTAAGDYQITYQVCEVAKPTNCATATATITVNKGQFMDGAAGVRYESDSANGFTDENGGYIYSQGDNIAFFLGGTMLGQQTQAAATLSPLDLVPGAEIPLTQKQSRAFIDDYDDYELFPKLSEMLNIVTMLYSVDQDKDSSNGIAINEDLHTFWADKSFNLKQEIDDLDRDNVINIAMYKAFDAELIAHAGIFFHFKSLDLIVAQQNLNPQVPGRTKELYYSNGELSEIYKIYLNADTNSTDWDYYETDDQGNLESLASYKDKYYWDNSVNYLGYAYYDGDIKSSSGVYTLDIHGKRLRRDFESQGEYNGSRWHEYNDIGLETADHYDEDGDSISDDSEYLTYDENGNTVSYEYDRDGDGVIEEKNTREYTNNVITTDSYYSLHDTEDGPQLLVDNVYHIYYNEQGNVIKEESDHNGDGSIDYVGEWTYNDAGQEIQYRGDNDLSDELYDSLAVTTYENGLLISYYNDYDGDGVNNYGYVNEYDERGNRIAYKYYSSNLDKPVHQNFYTFDDMNNRTQYMSDHNGDDIIDSINFYTYDEFGNQTGYGRYDGATTEGDPRYSYGYEYTLGSSFTDWWKLYY